MKSEPVWREEISKEIEYLTEGCRTLATFFHQAKSQNAPESLLNEMAQAWRDLDGVKQRLESIAHCFPSEKS